MAQHAHPLRVAVRRAGSTLGGLAFVGAASLVGWPAPAQAQANAQGVAGQAGTDPSPAVVTIPRLNAPVRLDGVVDEAAWDAVEPFPMTMYTPNFGGELTEATEVRIAHDDRFLYVSGRMYDSEPERIRTNTFYRDQYSGDDIVAVVIDSYNDYETAVWFVTNPAGVRQDRTVSNDAQFTSGRPMNSDWNSHWDVATSRNDKGWFAEFRIPFSTLGFQVSGGKTTMGLIIYRLVARKNERQVYPAIDPKWGGLGFAKPSQAQRIVLRDVRQSTPVYATPYSVGGFDRTPSADASAPPEYDATIETGLDLKYSPTSNLALDLTVNTDFAQVEADDQQINLTRFALFFPEKRQFFQERASTFDFNTGGFFNRLFHSRQIGLHQGEVVRIYGGARAVGRAGGTDFGLLNMQTAAHGDGSSENMGVLRVRQQVFNPYSTVGAMVTTRLGSHGQDNVAYGLDAVLRVVGDEYLLMQWAHTFDQATEQAGGLDAGLLRGRWERRRDDGFSYHGEFVRAGRDYLPGLGFQLRKDFTSAGGRLRYRRFSDAQSPLRSRAANLRTEHYFRNADGDAESREITAEAEFEFKGGARLTTGVTSSFESVADSFAVSDVFVTPGDYWFHEGAVMLMLARSDNFRGEFNASAGGFYGGSRVGVSLGPTWNVSKYLELGGGYEVNRLDFSERDVGAVAHLGRLRVQAALNPRLSVTAFAQYNSVNQRTGLNARFRYHFREATDLWIVYNEGLDHAGGQSLAEGARSASRIRSTGRTLLVKYSHAFVR